MATKKSSTSANPKNPGEYLKIERTTQKVKPLTVSRQLHITPAQLENIESWNTDRLPKGVYLEGILTRYAKLLDLSTDQFKRNYQAFFESQEVIKPKTKQAKQNIILTRVVLFGAIIIVALGAIGYVLLQTSSFASKPKLEISEPTDGSTIEGQTVLVTGETSEGSQVYVNGSPVLVNPDGEFSTDVILMPGLNNVEIRAINTFSRETIVNRKINNIPSLQEVDQQR